jgi:hypothetical protein
MTGYDLNLAEIRSDLEVNKSGLRVCLVGGEGRY